MTNEQLIEKALLFRKNAYAPLTGVQVGAALLTKSGECISGVNVESDSGIVHICAERAAIVNAISQGLTKFSKIAVAADFANPIPPCGFCRQALLEFAPDIEIIMTNLHGAVKTATIRELMPLAYTIEDRAD